MYLSKLNFSCKNYSRAEALGGSTVYALCQSCFKQIYNWAHGKGTLQCTTQNNEEFEKNDSIFWWDKADSDSDNFNQVHKENWDLLDCAKVKFDVTEPIQGISYH